MALGYDLWLLGERREVCNTHAQHTSVDRAGNDGLKACAVLRCRRQRTVATVANVVGKSLKNGSAKGAHKHTHTHVKTSENVFGVAPKCT